MPGIDSAEVDAFNAARLDAFVIRARRIAAHSLAQDQEKLVALSRATMTIIVDGDRSVLRHELPPEEVVESAAARVRPLLLSDEDCYLPNALSSIRHFVADQRVRAWTKAVGAQWKARTMETTGMRAAGTFVQIANTATGELAAMNDLQLALAWIYGDVVHHDRGRRHDAQLFGLKERYRAAVPLVAYVMVEASVVLDGIRDMYEKGSLPVADSALTGDVVLTSTTFEQDARVHFAPVGTDAPEDLETPLGSEWSPMGPDVVVAVPGAAETDVADSAGS